MFTYFDIYGANNQIDYPFAEINMFQKEWIPNTTFEKKVVSTHPSLEEIRIMAQGIEIIASPFKTINTKEDETRSIRLRDIKGIFVYCLSVFTIQSLYSNLLNLFKVY